MWSFIARANGQLDKRCSQQTHHPPISHTRPSLRSRLCVYMTPRDPDHFAPKKTVEHIGLFCLDYSADSDAFKNTLIIPLTTKTDCSAFVHRIFMNVTSFHTDSLKYFCECTDAFTCSITQMTCGLHIYTVSQQLIGVSVEEYDHLAPICSVLGLSSDYRLRSRPVSK